MLIQIDKLKRRPRQIIIDEQATDFPVLRELVDQEAVVFNAPINGICEATWAGDVIEVEGRLATTVTLPCCRCLVPVVSLLDFPVTLSYAGKENEDATDVEDVELQSDEIGLIPFPGPEIDLRPDIGQEVIMALPLQSLCKETCKGLCPVCGHNLNQGSCGCDSPVFHAGLAALKSFKVKQ